MFAFRPEEGSLGTTLTTVDATREGCGVRQEFHFWETVQGNAIYSLVDRNKTAAWNKVIMVVMKKYNA